MKHLDEMCCEQCRDKVKAIEARSFETPNENHAPIDDRRELLMLLEAMLASMAVQRERFIQASDAFALGVAELQVERGLLRESLQWVLDNGVLKMISYIDNKRFSQLVDCEKHEPVEPPERIRETLNVLLALGDAAAAML